MIPVIWGRFRGGAGAVPRAREVPGIWKQARRRCGGRTQESGNDRENFGAIPRAVSGLCGGTGEGEAAQRAIPEAVPEIWGRSRGRSRASLGLPAGDPEEDSGAVPQCRQPRAVPRAVPKKTLGQALGAEPEPGAPGGAKGGPGAEPIVIAVQVRVPASGQRRSPGHGGPGLPRTGHRSRSRPGHSRGAHGVLQVVGPRWEPAAGGGGAGRRWEALGSSGSWRWKVLGGTRLHCGVGVAAVGGCWDAERGTERHWGTYK